tara:strand:- start:2256 stop:2432 length:177 start_codon:yes stop_codon:yes gene_type:complete
MAKAMASGVGYNARALHHNFERIHLFYTNLQQKLNCNATALSGSPQATARLRYPQFNL